MDAIKIYEKIIQALEGSEPNEALVAIEFAQRKTQQEMYKKRETEHACASSLGAGSALAENYAINGRNVEIEAVELVRNIVREEIAAANSSVEKVPEAA